MQSPQETNSNILKTLETEIADRLKVSLPSDFYISAFPADISKFDHAMLDAAALVHFSGSRYGDTSDMNHARQARELRFAITLYLSGKYAGSEAYAILELVRAALQNVPLSKATPIRLISDQLADQNADQWVWQIDIACAVAAVAAHLHSPKPSYPLNRFQRTEEA